MKSKPEVKTAQLEAGNYERIKALKADKYARMSIRGIVNAAISLGLDTLEKGVVPQWAMSEQKSNR